MLSKFGTSFTIGFGENTNIPTGIYAFRYMSVFVRAQQNGTLVNLDYNGDGTNDITNIALNEGQVYFYDGTGSNPGTGSDVNTSIDLKAGAKITSNYPVGVDVAFGGIDASTFALRNVFILPGQYYGNTYYTPVYTTNTGTNAAPVNVFFFNSSGSTIQINWLAGTGATR